MTPNLEHALGILLCLWVSAIIIGFGLDIHFNCDGEENFPPPDN